MVHILTHGSRNGCNTERVDASTALITRHGGTTGEVFGYASDRDCYAAIMSGTPDLFHTILDSLADSFVANGVTRVVTDAWQNYNPIHDLANLLARTAATLASARLGHTITVLDYPVVSGPLSAAPTGPLVETLTLCDAQRDVKQAEVSQYPDVSSEFAELKTHEGLNLLALETLHQPLPFAELFPHQITPLYEQYGMQRVLSGHYTQVLGWNHVQVIAHSLLSSPVSPK